jgi:hypothetical protein
LDLLSVDGHVVVLGSRIAKDGPQLQFEQVGRNHASTFEGFCAVHDAAIFRPLDVAETADDAPLSEEQLYLFAYRSVVRELHMLSQSAVQSQALYQRAADRGATPRDPSSPIGMFAVDRMVASHSLFVYKDDLDAGLRTSSFSGLVHEIRRIPGPPRIAVSSLFSCKPRTKTKSEPIRIALNVLPVSADMSISVFSFIPSDAQQARAHLAPILQSKGQSRLYQLSKQILNSCENFVIHPSHFAKYTERQRQVIVAYFSHTLNIDALELDDQDLNLF